MWWQCWDIIWILEAYRESDEEFEWEVELAGADIETMQNITNHSFAIPGGLPIEGVMARSILSWFGFEAAEWDTDDKRLSLYVNPYRK